MTVYLTGPLGLPPDETKLNRLDWELDDTTKQRARFRITLLGIDEQQKIIELPLITGLVQCSPPTKMPFNPRTVDWQRVKRRIREARFQDWAKALSHENSDRLVQSIRFHESRDP